MKNLNPLLKNIITQNWSDYELLDSGDFEKLEKFGQVVCRRPEPQAVWAKSLTEKEWQSLANASFLRNKENEQKNSVDVDRGSWHLKKNCPEQWVMKFNYKDLEIKFRLGLTSFKHVGIFPEQSENWKYIYDNFKAISNTEKSFLNLFAYTGGATLAARSAGANAVHVDSVKQVLTWSNENMEINGLSGVRWMLEDALKFTEKDIRRGKKYNGIIVDPPAYGRGPNGEKWVLERDINQLLENCSKLLVEKNGFFILNLYSMSLSATISLSLAQKHFKNMKDIEFGELCVADKNDFVLPLGTYLRFKV